LILVSLLTLASWLNRIEIYISILRRKLLTPNDNTTLPDLNSKILLFQERFEKIAKPFGWKFNRHDLALLSGKILQRSEPLARSA